MSYQDGAFFSFCPPSHDCFTLGPILLPFNSLPFHFLLCFLRPNDTPFHGFTVLLICHISASNNSLISLFPIGYSRLPLSHFQARRRYLLYAMDGPCLATFFLLWELPMGRGRDKAAVKVLHALARFHGKTSSLTRYYGSARQCKADQ